MPYEHIEQIGDRGDERFALGLGARNGAGMVVAALPVVLVSAGWPLAARLPSVLGAVAVGLLATVESGGMPLYAWPLWWLRGRARMLAQGRRIAPDQLPGAAQQRPPLPLRVGGPVRYARRRAAVERGRG